MSEAELKERIRDLERDFDGLLHMFRQAQDRLRAAGIYYDKKGMGPLFDSGGRPMSAWAMQKITE